MSKERGVPQKNKFRHKLSEGRISLLFCPEDILNTGITAATLGMFQAIRNRAFNVLVYIESDENGLEDLKYSADRLLGPEAVHIFRFDDEESGGEEAE